MTENEKPVITWVKCDDWVALFIGDELEVCTHHVVTVDLLRTLGYKVRVGDAYDIDEDDYISDWGSLDDISEDVEWSDV